MIDKVQVVPICPSEIAVLWVATTVSDGFYTERAERSLQDLLQKCCKAAPPKKCREASTTVVLIQGGFDARVRWTLSDILPYRRCRRLKKKKKKGPRPIT